MNFFIREATEQDYEALSNIFTEADAMHSRALPHIFTSPKGLARSKELISDIIADENGALFVAEHSEQIIGLIHVLIRESADISLMIKRRYAYIGSVAVAKEFRGSAVGKALMKKAEQWAIQKGVPQFELNVWDFNQGAKAFFQRLGYTTLRHGMWKSV